MDPFAELARRIPGGGDPAEVWVTVERRAAAVRRRMLLALGSGAALVVFIAAATLFVPADDGTIEVAVSAPAPPATSATMGETDTTYALPMGSTACDEGVPTAGDVPTEEEAVSLVLAFLGDRASGAASTCLDPDGSAAFADGGFPTTIASRDVAPFGTTSTEQIVTVLLSHGGEVAREEYRVASIGGRALVTSVRAADVTNVPEPEARRVLAAFLDALAAEEWDAAADLLVDEGVADEVLVQIPDVFERGGAALADWCAGGGSCSEPYVIGEVRDIQPFALDFEVTFGHDGLPPRSMTVASFEGQLSVGSLPPTR